ncbi:DUF1453 domain-containing protein [Actinorhabdospora filicis]|uniref:DUF1453 domain-containing protein n=1 Tax=Actinorhabdospora filicis TaxID=1785913 RepID=A0A9W6SVM5_9ACTN|nr:hypothetical protein [Actinorhabdospora filicis]GLZ81581.1 DUF1453 domain-containing protein [Actinorhabdospora filicis]
MSSEAVAIAIPAAVLLVGWRQLTTRRVDRPGILILAAALTVMGLTTGVIDRDLLPLSILMLIVDLAFAAGAGAARAASVHVWVDERGVAWSRGTWWTVLLWAGSIAGRFGLYGIGLALGLRPEPKSALLFAGVTIGVQAALVAWRGTRIRAMSSVGA